MEWQLLISAISNIWFPDKNNERCLCSRCSSSWCEAFFCRCIFRIWSQCMRLSCDVAGARVDICEQLRFMQTCESNGEAAACWINEWMNANDGRNGISQIVAHIRSARIRSLDIPFWETNVNDKICMREHTGHTVVRGGRLVRWNRWEKPSCYCVSVLTCPVCQSMHMHNHSRCCAMSSQMFSHCVSLLYNVENPSSG